MSSVEEQSLQHLHDIKDSLKSKDNTILRLRQFIQVLQKENEEKEKKYASEIKRLHDELLKTKKQKRKLKKQVKIFAKTTKNDEQIDKKNENEELEAHQEAEEEHPGKKKVRFKLPSASDVDQCIAQITELKTETNQQKEQLSTLQKVNEEYLGQIEQYKKMLNYEGEQLKKTRDEYLTYVNSSKEEVRALKQQIFVLKTVLQQTNAELHNLTMNVRLQHSHDPS